MVDLPHSPQGKWLKGKLQGTKYLDISFISKYFSVLDYLFLLPQELNYYPVFR